MTYSKMILESIWSYTRTNVMQLYKYVRAYIVQIRSICNILYAIMCACTVHAHCLPE